MLAAQAVYSHREPPPPMIRIRPSDVQLIIHVPCVANITLTKVRCENIWPVMQKPLNLQTALECGHVQSAKPCLLMKMVSVQNQESIRFKLKNPTMS